MRELTQKELVTTALFLLGGDKQAYDTEDIAIKAAEIAPGKFSWRKYRDNIDLDLVRSALKNAKIELKYVVGSQKKGWMLSSTGFQFARDSRKKSWAKPIEREPEREQLQVNKEKERLFASEAYRYFMDNGEAGIEKMPKVIIDDFFRINDYVKGEARFKKIARIENLFMDDPDLGVIVKKLARLEENYGK